MQVGVVESIDGGRTWRLLGGPRHGQSVTVVGADELIVNGGGDAARSTDGGGTWSPLKVPTSQWS